MKILMNKVQLRLSSTQMVNQMGRQDAYNDWKTGIGPWLPSTLDLVLKSPVLGLHKVQKNGCDSQYVLHCMQNNTPLHPFISTFFKRFPRQSRSVLSYSHSKTGLPWKRKFSTNHVLLATFFFLDAIPFLLLFMSLSQHIDTSIHMQKLTKTISPPVLASCFLHPFHSNLQTPNKAVVTALLSDRSTVKAQSGICLFNDTSELVKAMVGECLSISFSPCRVL